MDPCTYPKRKRETESDPKYTSCLCNEIILDLSDFKEKKLLDPIQKY